MNDLNQSPTSEPPSLPAQPERPSLPTQRVVGRASVPTVAPLPVVAPTLEAAQSRRSAGVTYRSDPDQVVGSTGYESLTGHIFSQIEANPAEPPSRTTRVVVVMVVALGVVVVAALIAAAVASDVISTIITRA